MNTVLKIAPVLVVFLMSFCQVAFAGGGDGVGGGVVEPTNQNGNVPVGSNSSGYQSGGSSNLQPNYSNGSSSPSYQPNTSSSSGLQPFSGNTSITPISPIQSSGYLQQTTSYYNSGGTQACGLSLYGNVGNSNTQLATVYQAGFNLSTQKCVDQKKLETIRQEAETKRIKLNVQGDVLINCMRERTNALSLKQNPDSICKVPDLSLMEGVLR
jgi:hypothetical protein